MLPGKMGGVYYDRILRLFCIFSRGTVEKIEKLNRLNDSAEFIMSYVESKEPLITELEERRELVEAMKDVKKRLSAAVHWIHSCYG